SPDNGHNSVSSLNKTCLEKCLLRHFSSVGFWGLVNNAGISTFGETGWLSMEKYEKFADVNLLGSIRTTLAFLPLLRKYKGNANPPLFRVVCIIQPGNHARSTKIQPPVSAEEIWNELSKEEKADYNKEYVQERANFFNSILSKGSTNGSEVVDAMVDALMSPAPKARYGSEDSSMEHQPPARQVSHIKPKTLL
uniref:Uncharacterized protein n=1 Tax=Bubo bubo TaxID=30461 RepID=A0A8C0EJ34_BUBBB